MRPKTLNMHLYLRLFVCLFAFCLCLTETVAMSPEPHQKESKKSAKLLIEGGWQVFGGSNDIKETINEHYSKLSKSKGKLMPLEGHAVASHINVAVARAKSDAARQYASMFETRVEGSSSTHIVNVEGDDNSSHITMDSHTRTNTEQNVKSLVPSAVFYRTLRNGKIEVIALYLVNKIL